jgi:hypothetical protein
MGVVYPLGTASTSSGVAVSALEGFKFPLGSAQPVGVPTPQVQLSCSDVLGSHMASIESLGAPSPKVPTAFQYATPLPLTAAVPGEVPTPQGTASLNAKQLSSLETSSPQAIISPPGLPKLQGEFIEEGDDSLPSSPSSSSSSVQRLERDVGRWERRTRGKRAPTPPARGRVVRDIPTTFPESYSHNPLGSHESTDIASSSTLGVDEPSPYISHPASSYITHPEIFALKDNESLSDHIIKIQTVQGHRKSLIMPFTIRPEGSDQVYNIHALIDTGCELNLIKRGLLPLKYFKAPKTSIRLVTANGSQLGGGNRQTFQKLWTFGQSSHEGVNLNFGTWFFEAEIACDAILSFRWLSQCNLDVLCKRHGLQLNDKDTFFIPGLDETQVPESSGQLKIHVVSPLGGDEESQSSNQGLPQVAQPMLTPFSKTISFNPPVKNDTSNEEVEELINMEKVLYLKCLRLRVFPEDERRVEMEFDAPTWVALVDNFLPMEDEIHYARSVVTGSEPISDPQVEKIKAEVIERFSDSVFKKTLGKIPPVRGPLGQAKIEIKPGFSNVKQRAFQLAGDRREALIKLIRDLEKEGKIEEGCSDWSSPAFPVPKKDPGKWRLVIDYRKLNDATVVDGHPILRIEEILERQGKFKIWSVLDLKDGFHQIPIHPDSRHYTCMSTPIGTFQWVVLPMGLKNAPSVFQRVMDWIFKDFPHVDPYIDDIIIGSTGSTMEEMIETHTKDLVAVLEQLAKYELLVSAEKAQLYMKKVEFCGHVMTMGARTPAPGKLMALQKWELPPVVTLLRGFFRSLQLLFILYQRLC